MNYGLGIFKRLARCSVLFLLLPRITWSGDSDGRMESVSVSPDGKLLAVDFVKGNASFIYKIPVDSGVAMRLTDAKDGEESSPAFSPDGKTIIFSRSGSYGSSSPIAQPHPHAWDFYASYLDGTGLRQLTNENFYMASPASVSADGRSMLVVTEGLYNNGQICIYSLDGS